MSKPRSEKYKDQFVRWHPGQFIAIDLIDEVFEKESDKGRRIARSSQLEADGALFNVMMDVVVPKREKPSK